MPRERQVPGDIVRDPRTGDTYWFPNHDRGREARDKFVRHTGGKPEPMYDGEKYSPETKPKTG